MEKGYKGIEDKWTVIRKKKKVESIESVLKKLELDYDEKKLVESVDRSHKVWYN